MFSRYSNDCGTGCSRFMLQCGTNEMLQCTCLLVVGEVRVYNSKRGQIYAKMSETAVGRKKADRMLCRGVDKLPHHPLAHLGGQHWQGGTDVRAPCLISAASAEAERLCPRGRNWHKSLYTAVKQRLGETEDIRTMNKAEARINVPVSSALNFGFAPVALSNVRKLNGVGRRIRGRRRRSISAQAYIYQSRIV